MIRVITNHSQIGQYLCDYNYGGFIINIWEVITNCTSADDVYTHSNYKLYK
jgi:hypothetical protein